jgi:ATP/maltotriose-dependent transcriptional regulator MalT
MTQAIPTVQGGTLLYQHDGQDHQLTIGTAAWYSWLSTATTFAFTSTYGMFTARKERPGNQRGGWYWKAYRKQQGKLHRAYLGKSEDLTLGRLNAVAQALASPSSMPEQGGTGKEMAAQGTTSVLPDPLLATKLRVPRPPGHLVPRSHLTERLHRAMERPLALIAAPAGFGKTTLLCAWLAHVPLPVAWVSLDDRDDDPSRFWAYTLTALERLLPGSGAAALALLQALPPQPLETILTTLINQLTVLSQEAVLVWDDYHLISTPAIHTSVTYLVDHLPPCLHLVLATRADPPLPLARLRARGQLTELRASDLRFTPEEAAAFLTQTMGLTLSAEEISTLSTRTEGWIAGLQLAALSLQGRTDTPGFMQAFTGSHRHVVDYLVQEVLARQPDHLQTFLLETAVLERMTGSLCEAVTGRLEGEAMVERLEQANLFLVPLDDERQWYRYHHLFADVLRQRLQRRWPERVPELHRRASTWYERHGLLYDAVGHALAAADFERTALLLEHLGETMLRRGEGVLLLHWLETLPSALLRHRVQLRLFQAWVLYLTGRLDEVEPHLQELERNLDESHESLPGAAQGSSAEPAVDQTRNSTAIAGEVATLRATMAATRGDVARMIDQAHLALGRLPEDNVRLRGLVSWSLGVAYWLGDDVVAASQTFAEARALSQRADNIHAVMMISSDLAYMQVLRGQLHQAAHTCEQALQLASERFGWLPSMGQVHVGMGELLREWNDLDAATRHLMQGLELDEQIGNVGKLLRGYLALGRVKQALGEREAALKMMQQAEHLAQKYRHLPQFVALAAAARARVALAQGDIGAAERWAHEAGPDVNEELSHLREPEYLTLVRVQLATGQTDEAMQLLLRLQQAAESGGRRGCVIELLILQALALQAQGHAARATITLTRALSLAEPEGYMRLFIDEGPRMAELLSTLIHAQQKGHLAASPPVSPNYLHRLRAYFEAPAVDRPPAERSSGSLADPLSERELAVLRLLVAGRSNQAIAEELVVTVGTVKTHLHHIYGKLNASSRVQAVARARELQLLS